MLVSHWVDAHQSAEEVVAGLRVEVAARRPGAVGRVDLLNPCIDERATKQWRSNWGSEEFNSIFLNDWDIAQGRILLLEVTEGVPKR